MVNEDRQRAIDILDRSSSALAIWLEHPKCDDYDDEDNEMLFGDFIADILLLASAAGHIPADVVERAMSYVEADIDAISKFVASQVGPDPA